jgi:poly-gamma-glutamate capsule biosynthesis protein CapA/YwtB (metallophosphatase superfamily)
MLARLVSATIAVRGPCHVWGDVLPLLRSADLTLVNLECVIATSGAKFLPRRVFYFRAVPEALQALSLAGIDYVSLANNHAMDYQAPALLETIRRLDAAGIAHAGAGPDLEQAEQPAMLSAGGVKVGVVSFADHFDLYVSTSTRAGTNVIGIETHGPDFARVVRALARARSAGADVVVLSIHWGPNMRVAPTAAFVEFAHAVMDAGADIFHGHSAHIFQGVQLYRGKPILFDTGDLLDDYAIDERLRNDLQLLFLVEGTGSGGWRVEMVPLLIGDMQVNLARGGDFHEICRRMRRLSARFGTRIERSGDRLIAGALHE